MNSFRTDFVDFWPRYLLRSRTVAKMQIVATAITPPTMPKSKGKLSSLLTIISAEGSEYGDWSSDLFRLNFAMRNDTIFVLIESLEMTAFSSPKVVFRFCQILLSSLKQT